jgi:hypothetical protein
MLGERRRRPPCWPARWSGALLVLRVGRTAGLVAVLAALLATAGTLWALAGQPST